MKRLLFPIFFILICMAGTDAQTPTPTPQASPANTGTPSLQEYREILEHERKLLEEQSEKYYGRIDTLINRSLWVFGTIGGLALLLLTGAAGLFIRQQGKNKAEMKTIAREYIKEQAAEYIDTEMNTLRGKVERLNLEVKEFQAANEQPITWVFSGTEVTAPQEKEALISRGIRNISDFTPGIGEELDDLGNPALVIYSYDRSGEGHNRLRRIVEILREKNPPVPLIIYTYNAALPEYRLQEPDRRVIGDYLWYLAANYPVTLISQTQTLLRDIRQITRN
jgi:hypothetical protein